MKYHNPFAKSTQRPVKLDWGFAFSAVSEIDALRIAYAYRYDRQHDVIIELLPDESYQVTLLTTAHTHTERKCLK